MNISTIAALQRLAQQQPQIPQPAAPLVGPGPFAPPGVGAPPLTMEPTFAPQAPLPRLDTGFIDSYSGQRPVEPVERKATFLEKLAAALTGFGEGMAGRGPEYLAYLTAERERPRREYEAKLEDYERRRTRGLEIAEDRQRRQQETLQRRADAQAERDYESWKADRGYLHQDARDAADRAFRLELEARRQREAIAEAARQERREREREARHISDQYFGLTKNKGLADEIGLYRAGLRDSLSPAAVRLYNDVTELGNKQMRAALAVSSGSGRGRASNAAVKVAEEVEASKGELIVFLQNFGRFTPEQRATEERRIRARIGRALGHLQRFPGQLEGGLDPNGWPWVKIPTPQGSVGLVPEGQPTGQQPQAQQPDPLGVR